MKIDAKIVKTFDTGNIKAICDVTLDDAFAIHGVKLIKGQNGDFVSMPSDKWKNTKGDVKHNDVVHPLDSDTRAQLYQAVSTACDAHMQNIESVNVPFGMN